MRRVVLLLLLFALVLAGCGGPTDTTVPDPPQAKPLVEADNGKVDQIISGWKQAVRVELEAQQIKPETIEEKVYESTASLQDIAAFYDKLTEKGWTKDRRVPGVQDGLLLVGYQIGSTGSLVVGAIDTAQFGGSGVVIYTAKGTK